MLEIMEWKQFNKIKLNEIPEDSGIYEFWIKSNSVKQGKHYYGKTQNLRSRFDDYIGYFKDSKNPKSHNSIFNSSIQRHGTNNLYYRFIEQIPRELYDSNTLYYEEYLKELEIKHIAEAYGKEECLFNLTSGGDGGDYYNHLSEEEKQKWAENSRKAALERFKDPRNHPWYDRRHSEESRKLMRENQLGSKNSFAGHHHTPESRNKISEANKGEKSACYKKECDNRNIEELVKQGYNMVEISEIMGNISPSGISDRIKKHIFTEEEYAKYVHESYSKRSSGKNNPMYNQNHTPQTCQKLSENHADVSGANNPRSLYENMWDINCVQYHKGDMFKDNTNLNPRKCFNVKYKGKKLNIGGFYDFISCEIIYKLICKYKGD